VSIAATHTRLGGHVVVETLSALGAEVAFGVPGVHALAIWEALRTAELRGCGTRTELCAGFAADGYARSTGRPAPLLLSTGPGALNSMTAIMEAASAHVPVVAISSQIPRDLLGRGRGYLHELPDQLSSFAPVVKHAARAQSVDAIPDVLAQAWTVAMTAPSGPVYVEIPVDLLNAEASVPTVQEISLTLPRTPASAQAARAAAHLLNEANRPMIWAGGGTLRSGASEEVRELAERLQAPVATTYMGKGAVADDHPLACGCGCDEAAFQELLGGADVVLALGTELGAETTAQYKLRFSGQLIHLDAAQSRIGATYPALGLVGDVKATLEMLIPQIEPRSDAEPARALVSDMRARIAAGLRAQGRDTELGLLDTIERALPENAITAWDMTILAYWAAPHLPLYTGQQFHYPLGSGTLGYAWPAAIGASLAHPQRAVLAVAGDGGIQYGLGELATARQLGAQAKLLVVDDGGYGILREYQRDTYGETTAVDLVQPDFAALAQAFGVPVRTGGPGALAENLDWAFAEPGPAIVVLSATIAVAQPTP
jgi:acetolactate synthase I/II/III large subunit